MLTSVYWYSAVGHCRKVSSESSSQSSDAECVRKENHLAFSVIHPSLFPQLIKDLLNALPNMFISTRETHSALGPALQAAFKLMSPTGGRVSVFQTQLPSLGAGLLQSREDPNQRSSTKVLCVVSILTMSVSFPHKLKSSVSVSSSLLRQQ